MQPLYGGGMKFTDKYIANLGPQEKQYVKREGEGFAIRVLPTGQKTWLFIYTFDGKRRQMNLGSYPDTKLADARTVHKAASAMLTDKQHPRDPQEERDQRHDADRQKREERRKAPTVADLVDDYIKRHAKRFKRSWKKDEQILNREVVSIWGERKAADIVKRDVNQLLEKIVDRSAPIMANNTFAVIRKMFNWAIEQDILQHTPCTGVKPPAPKVSRERVLSEAEIKTLWENIDRTDLNMSLQVRRGLKLILLTAQRPGEVIGMHTAEIDGDWWTIPVERSKNGKLHRVYLTPLVKVLIAEATEEVKAAKEKAEKRKARKTDQGRAAGQGDNEYSGYIFPCSHAGKNQPLGDTAFAVAVGRNLAYPLTDAKGNPLYKKDGKQATENRLGVDHFTPHDLRRTAATFMAGMGFMDEIIDAVLNHSKKGIIRTYNRHDYDKEKQQALEAWERKLSSIITGKKGKVVPIETAKKAA